MFSMEFMTTLKDVFHDHESYRQRWKDEANEMRPSNFLQQSTIAERLFADFVASASFGYDEAFHSTYLTSVRHRNGVEDLLNHGIFQDTWLTIQNLHKDQKNKERADEDTKREQENNVTDDAKQADANESKADKDETQDATKEDDANAAWRNYAQQTVSSVINLHQNPVVRSELIELVKKQKLWNKSHEKAIEPLLSIMMRS